MMDARDETHLNVLRLLANNPRMSQRDLAQALGVSLGKVNYCLNALLNKGVIKMHNFRNSQNKLGYVYLLTPAGIAEKACLTAAFLRQKLKEYETLREEIVVLQFEVEQFQDAHESLNLLGNQS